MTGIQEVEFVEALEADEADRGLTVLRQQLLAMQAEATPAPAAITVANGPLQVTVSWAGAPVAETAPAPAPAAVAPAPPVLAAVPETVSEPGTFALESETVGVFYRSKEPGSAPFVEEGDVVRAGQQVGIVEAMKLMIPLAAKRDGRVLRFEVDNAQAVEHGQVVIVFEALT